MNKYEIKRLDKPAHNEIIETEENLIIGEEYARMIDDKWFQVLRKIITNEDKFKNANTKEFAKLLFDFTIDLYCEDIEGLCNIECRESGGECNGCIEKWLKMEVK